jgi:hypothetical protein
MNPQRFIDIVNTFQEKLSREALMSKKIIFIALFMMLILPSRAMSANEDELTQLDTQRNEALNKITAGLIEGKVFPNIARQLKEELDNVTKLESHARADQVVPTTEIYNISKCLDKARTDIKAQTHTTKVWMGINSRDTTLHNKIADALAAGKINKEQAKTLEQEYEKLRNREVSGYPINALEFTDAITIADDLQILSNKIDQLIASAGNVH